MGLILVGRRSGCVCRMQLSSWHFQSEMFSVAWEVINWRRGTYKVQNVRGVPSFCQVGGQLWMERWHGCGQPGGPSSTPRHPRAINESMCKWGSEHQAFITVTIRSLQSLSTLMSGGIMLCSCLLVHPTSLPFNPLVWASPLEDSWANTLN